MPYWNSEIVSVSGERVFELPTSKREVDFVVLRQNKPLFAVECKSGERIVSRAIFYFRDRTPIRRFYQVHLGDKDYEKDGVRVVPLRTFSSEAGLV